jgi:hypothetical protein
VRRCRRVITVGILLIPLAILISVVYFSLRNGISPTPSSGKQTKAILRMIPADISGNVYDLGSGWGTLALAVAKHLPQCQVIGFESSPIPYAISVILASLSHARNLKFLRLDFLKTSLADAKLVLCYLYPGGMQKLKPKLERELSPGTLVISNTFSIPGWAPAEVFHGEDFFHSPVYVYKVREEEV